MRKYIAVVLTVILVVALPSPSLCFEGCGRLVTDIEGGCLWFMADEGGAYVLSDYGGYSAGDYVFVSGSIDPFCNVWCGTFQAICLDNSIISSCECCEGIRGNVDEDDDEQIDISDLVCLVEYMFCQYPEVCCVPHCIDEADIDGSGDIDISDLVYLVDFIFMAGPQPTPCQAGFIAPVNSLIHVSLWESLLPSARTQKFRCATETIYPCCNFAIINRMSIVGSAISVEFSGIYQPLICLTALGPALANLHLGSLTSGTYSLAFENGAQVSGRLIVSEEAFHITCDDSSIVVFDRAELRRVPDNTIWGSIGYHTPESEPTVQLFLDSLVSIGAAVGSFTPGYYGYFSIDADGDIEPPGNHGYYYLRPYIFEYDADTVVLHQLVRNFGITYDNAMYISLYDSDGNKFYSWVLSRE